MRQDDQHPDDRELLLSLDGELPAHDQRSVARHLTSCSACRDRRNHLLHISALLAERQHRHVEDAAFVRGSRARLAARLDEAARHQARFAGGQCQLTTRVRGVGGLVMFHCGQPATGAAPQYVLSFAR